jgi:hypothetical protein
MDEYLIIQDYKALDKLILLFDRNTFEYITGVADRGQGPNEIANMGHIAVDEAHRRFYVTDHGKNRIFSYNLDSVWGGSSSYLPEVKTSMDETLFPDDYQIVNDSIVIGRIIQPIGTNNFKPAVGKMNLLTGEITLMPYKHPKITGRKRSSVVVSLEHGLYVEYYHNHDLMTICNLDGHFICNICGPDWSEDVKPAYNYYCKAVFCADRIYTSYLGENGINEKMQSNLPAKLHVFDLDGNYIHTLETGLHISDFCYDRDNNRLIMCFNDDVQFGYLPLD